MFNIVHAQVLERRTREAYVHYVDTDRRLDEWVPESALQPLSSVAVRPTEVSKAGSGRLRPIPSRMLKKERDVCGFGILKRLSPSHHLPQNTVDDILAENSPTPASQSDVDIPLDEEEKDMLEHKRITAKRNYHQVIFGQWQMKTWSVLPHRTPRFTYPGSHE